MGNKKVQLKFREIDREIFDAVLDGSKKVETRAATEKFKDLKIGDIVILVCGKEKVEKKIKQVKTYKTIDDLLKENKVSSINPKFTSKEELGKMYFSFPNYEEKIEKFGLIAMEFE